MRLLIDLFACQSASRGRGLGRYAGSVTQALLEIAGPVDIWLAGNGLYQDRFEELRKRFAPVLPPGRLVTYYHHAQVEVEQDSDFHQLAAAVSTRALQMLAPDIAWSPSPFEGWNETGNPMLPAGADSSSSVVATVHDFIPLVFPIEYLERTPGYKKWYLQRVALLHRCDLLIADSEATRNDALRFLGIPENRIVTVPLAADPFFTRISAEGAGVRDMLHRLGINKPFILFIGNADFRKNVDGMLRAFSMLPDFLRSSHQVVLTQVGDPDDFALKIRARGIPSSSVVVAGAVSDEDLRALYSTCALFVFPSLYEGFGIPLLEAMACGAPTIAGDNSSLPEVMGLRESLFDASNPDSIARAITAALANDGFRLELSEYGLKRCRDFTWRKTALRTLEAMQELLARNVRKSTSLAVSRRKKVAYVSPLPPSATGVADYTRELLPHLFRYFDIDIFADLSDGSGDDFLNANFRIYDFRELPSRYNDYRSTIYQFGNSPFHTFMVDLIEACPGVVVLHDFFLSNLAYDLEFLRGEVGAFSREIDEAHGLRGLIDFISFGHEHARQHWPINKRVVHAAIAIVAHSKHQRQLFERFFGSAWSPRVELVSAPRVLEPATTADERGAARRRLAVASDCLLVCSFGFLASTKRCELIIESFAKAARHTAHPMRLILVGADDGGPYRQALMETARRCNVVELFSITGFVDADSYRLHLQCADIAVQLRIDSRGETSRTVLDCLAHGVPTIVNSYASLADHGQDAVVALHSDPSCDELSEALRRLAGDDQLRRQYSATARSEVAVHHSPALVAAQYRDVLDVALRDDERSVVEAIGLISRGRHGLNAEALARAIQVNDQVRQSPRLLIDVTRIAASDLNSGIERVISCLIREFAMRSEPSLIVELFRLQDALPFRAFRFAERVFSLPPGSLGQEIEITIRPGDRLLMLDSSWTDFDRFKDLFSRVRSVGGTITGVVYDLIPIRFPQHCHDYVLSVFTDWLRSIVLESDRIVCISKSVADDLRNYLDEGGVANVAPPAITFAHLGADVGEKPDRERVNPNLANFVDQSSAVFVTIGTIEPRKGHSTMLSAFDRLWQRGSDASLIVIGREGWNVADIMSTLRNHPELGRKLLLLENASDADVVFAYASATANICSSATEGFGLPIVESARQGTPSILSDIPVFREIGGRGAAYFQYGDAAALADQIDCLTQMSSAQRRDMAARTRTFTWEEAATDWLSAIAPTAVKSMQDNPMFR